MSMDLPWVPEASVRCIPSNRDLSTGNASSCGNCSGNGDL